jgi:hypothetical protein
MGEVTFNSKIFYDRLADVGDENIEFLMLFKPYTENSS